MTDNSKQPGSIASSPQLLLTVPTPPWRGPYLGTMSLKPFSFSGNAFYAYLRDLTLPVHCARIVCFLVLAASLLVSSTNGIMWNCIRKFL